MNDIMAGLRRGAETKSKGTGGRKGSNYARWKPPQCSDEILRYLTPEEALGTQVAEPVVFLKAEYVDEFVKVDENGQPLLSPIINPAYHFRSHTVPTMVQPKGRAAFQKFVDLVCAAGPDAHTPAPCIGCYATDHGEDMAPKDQWAFNIAHLGWYHESPFVKDGAIVMRKDSRSPVMLKNECKTHKTQNIAFQRKDQALGGRPTAQACDGCQQQHGFVFGDHKYIQVGKNQLSDILAIDNELKSTCKYCGSGVLLVAFKCGNEKCGVEVVDIGQSGWVQAQVDSFSKTSMHCTTCNYQGLPGSVYECGYGSVPGCADNTKGMPLSIFDVVLWLQREGENIKSKIAVKRWVPISKFTLPDGSLPGGKPLESALLDIAPKTFDMKLTFAPLNPTEQARSVNRSNPFLAQPAQPPTQQYQAYGQPPQQAPAPYGQPPAPAGYGPPGYQPPVQQPPQSYGPPPGTPNYGK